MGFQQLSTSIPILVDTNIFQDTQIYKDPGCHAILIVKSGHVIINSANQNSFICTEGFALNANEGPFHIKIPKTRSTEYILITYRLFPENHEWELTGPLYSMSENKIFYMIDELIRIRTVDDHKDYDEEPEVKSFKERLMLERILFIYLYESTVKKDQKTTMCLVEETVSYLNQHYMLEIKLPMLAERARLSVGHYTVLFKKYTGMTVNAYLVRLRIEKAKQFLIQSNITAKEVGISVGFLDYFHFSRSFKKEVGFSPKLFRESMKKSENTTC